MATKGYFMITVEEEFYRNYYQNVLRELKAVPEVDSIERISGTYNLLVKVTAPMRVIFVANKILPNKWVKRFCILKVEPFKPRDYEGVTVDELIRLEGLIPKSSGSYGGLTVEERLRIKRLIHESRGSHGASVYRREYLSRKGGEMEITQQDWIAYEEVRTNPIAKLTGQVLFARVLGLPKEKLEWTRNHYCELDKKFSMEK